MAARDRIGFDRELRLEWLDAVAALAAEGAGVQDARSRLDDYLRDTLGGKGTSGHRGKTITVLSTIWIATDEELEPLRRLAIRLLAEAEPSQRIAIHWGLALSAYPFFGDVADAVGRLLKLQGDVQRIGVVRRMYESWGERPAVSRATRATWQSLVWWKVLSPSDRRGQYLPIPRPIELSTALEVFLAEAALNWSGKRPLALASLASLPCLFPFDMSDAPTAMRASDRLSVTREGSNVEMVRRCVERRA